MAEIVKLLTCLTLSYMEYWNFRQFRYNLKYVFVENYAETLKVAVPALIYVVQNSLLYVSASNLDAATNQVCN